VEAYDVQIRQSALDHGRNACLFIEIVGASATEYIGAKRSGSLLFLQTFTFSSFRKID